MIVSSALGKNEVPVPKQDRLVKVYNQLYQKAKADPKVSEGRNVANPKNGKVVWSKVRSEYRRLWLEYHPRVKAAMLFEQRSKAYGGGNRGLGYAMTLERYNSESVWKCVNDLVKHESGWNHTVANYEGSGAYGLGQALPASKMAKYGADYLTNPRTQLRWFFDYVEIRYGGACNAWYTWLSRSPHWY